MSIISLEYRPKSKIALMHDLDNVFNNYVMYMASTLKFVPQPVSQPVISTV